MRLSQLSLFFQVTAYFDHDHNDSPVRVSHNISASLFSDRPQRFRCCWTHSRDIQINFRSKLVYDIFELGRDYIGASIKIKLV